MGFSVLMSVYIREDAAAFRRSLESVVSQSLIPDEVVIMQDGILTDELTEVLNFYMERYQYIRTYRFPKNVKLGRALCKGVELCSQELIARMDTDDVAVPMRFERQYRFMQEHPEISVSGGEIEEVLESGQRVRKKMPATETDISNYARYRNPLNHMTVMFRRSDVLECGNYRHFPFLEDYDLWSRMLAAGKRFCNIPEVFVEVHTDREMYHRRGGWKYFKQYRKLRLNQQQLGLTNYFQCGLGLVLTFGMTMMPNGMRQFTYRGMLRRKMT